MLTIICGEDIIVSRKYFQDLKTKYSKNNFEIHNIQAREVEEMKKWLINSPSLFSQKRVYFTDNLMKVLKKAAKKVIEEIESIAGLGDIELYDWEDGLTARELKSIKGATVKEFKPSGNIFKLLDACFPMNKNQFLPYLNSVVKTMDENFIFIMLVKHIRNLILIKQDIIPPRMQKWQASRLTTQARLWPFAKLIDYYQSLFRVEIRNKTSTNPYSLKESIEILTCFYL